MGPAYHKEGSHELGSPWKHPWLLTSWEDATAELCCRNFTLDIQHGKRCFTNKRSFGNVWKKRVKLQKTSFSFDFRKKSHDGTKVVAPTTYKVISYNFIFIGEAPHHSGYPIFKATFFRGEITPVMDPIPPR